MPKTYLVDFGLLDIKISGVTFWWKWYYKHEILGGGVTYVMVTCQDI